MNYTRELDGSVRAVAPLTSMNGRGPEVTFVARNVRERSTGYYADIAILAGEIVWDYGEIRFRRADERLSLANKAHKQAGEEFQKHLSATRLVAMLGEFCYGLWGAHLGSIDAGRVAGDRKRRQEYLMRPYLLKNAGAIMYSPPGNGKSYMAGVMAVTIDYGLEGSPVGEPTNKYPVLYINLERSRESMEARLGDVNVALGLDEGRMLPMINARGRSLADVAERARQVIAEEGIQFVVLDSLSRGTPGDLNNNADMNLSMNLLNSFGVGWLALGHPSRGDATRMGFSVMSDAAADVMIRLDSARDQATGDIVTEMSVTKANDMRWPAKRYVAFEFDQDPDKGLLKVRAATQEAHQRLKAASGGDTNPARIASLLQVSPMTYEEIAEALGLTEDVVRSTVRRMTNVAAMDDLNERGRKVWYLKGSA